VSFDAAVATGHRPALEDKVAVITGGAHGIGREAVRLFIAAGAKVVTCDLDTQALGELTSSLGDDVLGVHADIATHEGVASVVQAAATRFAKVDVLYNNAGVGTLSDSFLLVHETPYEVFEKTLQINLWSTFAMTHETLPLMLGRPASIINVGSIYALVAGAGSVSYIASKGAVVAMTRSIAFDYGSQGVRANVICPGYTDTRMVSDYTSKAPDPARAGAEFAAAHLLGRIGRPEEIAAAALWLASDASTFVTGAVIPVDGGYTAK